MTTLFKNKLFIAVCITSLMYTACVPSLVRKDANKNVPESYNNKDSQDTTNTAKVDMKDFFKDPYLRELIDTAIKNNQALNIILQEIQMAQYEVRARKGKIFPFVSVGAGAGAEKVGKYTRNGAVDQITDITPGQPIPKTLADLGFGASVSWQVDIWKQLRNAKKAAYFKMLSTEQGRRFMVTNLVAEIAQSYYELMALDNQLGILNANIEIQQNALHLVTLQKITGQVTELAVLRFQAEVNKNLARRYYILQKITETQNRINFLVGRYPKDIQRSSDTFTKLVPDSIMNGIPSQLLAYRTDIQQAEMELTAAKLDVKVAKANFYPVFNITAGIGYDAFNPKYLITSPESMVYNLAGNLVAPLINRSGVKAAYYTANAKQVKAAFNYERTVLNAYMETANQLANVNNLANSYNYKAQQVDALTESINISISLFKSARADYVEILLTQRDALESKMELIETKKQQMNAMVRMYQVLGGGWH